MENSENKQVPVLFEFRWVAKTALIIAAGATVVLLLAIYWITDDTGNSYADIIVRHSLTLQNLTPTVVVFGLVLVVTASITTWLIALYSSFRIAGPLYRFSQNLSQIIDNAFAIPLPIRKTDLLQNEWREFDRSQARLRQHYTDLHQELKTCEQIIQPQADINIDAVEQALLGLQEVEHRVQL